MRNDDLLPWRTEAVTRRMPALCPELDLMNLLHGLIGPRSFRRMRRGQGKIAPADGSETA
ncbi:MAG: hypothetical protein O3A94_09410 [Proteobacteria bacterium]|nr:hypothetical protein [Pseudomonadota bacterium]